jgi:hypothetical protein
MKLYTEQQLKEAMKTIALHVYDKRESNDCNTTFTINILINNLEPYISNDCNKIISDEKIQMYAANFCLTAFNSTINDAFISGAKWVIEHLNPES